MGLQRILQTEVEASVVLTTLSWAARGRANEYDGVDPDKHTRIARTHNAYRCAQQTCSDHECSNSQAFAPNCIEPETGERWEHNIRMGSDCRAQRETRRRTY